MADGSRKPIKDVKPGDRVIATDPTTGKTSVKVVTDQRVHESERELYEISVLTLKGVGKITATDAHPFWVSSLRKWKHAEDLKPGYRFTTADNRPATVLGTRSFSKVQLVYNLTVDGTHTYYVGVAGRGQTAAADVLVHNCETGPSRPKATDLLRSSRTIRPLPSRLRRTMPGGGSISATAPSNPLQSLHAPLSGTTARSLKEVASRCGSTASTGSTWRTSAVETGLCTSRITRTTKENLSTTSMRASSTAFLVRSAEESGTILVISEPFTEA
ncbi:intein [Lentzea atacamensis]|uniref:Intein n=1 Tax=Lentzea atacamensis TaxID=531938 RepID=A0ABX9EMP6_9PSEU|nr:intein [Lentzea atacamensis]